MGTGGGGNREPSGACGGRGRLTWGGSGEPGCVSGSGSGGGGSWGWGSSLAGGGRGRRTWGGGGARGGAWESGSDGSGVPGGRGGTWGSGSGASGWLRRGRSVSAVGQCAVRGAERERRRLRDRASSLELGQSGDVGSLWGASRGAAWCWGGGGVPRCPWIRHLGVWWR